MLYAVRRHGKTENGRQPPEIASYGNNYAPK